MCRRVSVGLAQNPRRAFSEERYRVTFFAPSMVTPAWRTRKLHVGRGGILRAKSDPGSFFPYNKICRTRFVALDSFDRCCPN